MRRFGVLCLIGLFLAMPFVVAEDGIRPYSSSATVAASGGRVVIRVQYKDGCPRSNSIVDFFDDSHGGGEQTLGATNESGYVSDTIFLPNTLYRFDAYWPDLAHQFGLEECLVTNGNGDGSTTITNNSEITPPTITVLSPQNQTYDGRLVPLNFTVYDYSPISWMGYSLDGQANTTVTSNVTLNVNTGSHSVVVYANDTYGNMGSSGTVYFFSFGCLVVIRCQYLDGYPRSNAYVQIWHFVKGFIGFCGTTNETGYCVKYMNLLPNTLYKTNATYPDGITLFGYNNFITDSNGDTSTTITANFEITPPNITILSPQNLTYYNSSVPLTSTVYDYSPISWTGYSLDKQANTTITGNTIISVEDGAHEIVVYANDTFGNMGSSQTVCFTVNSSLYEPWETSFIGLDRYPIVGFAEYNGSLYTTSNNLLYAFDGDSWNVIEAPTHTLSILSFEGELVVAGKGGIYLYNGTGFTQVITASSYYKMLGIYTDTLYAGTLIDKPPTLYYCNGSPENPADWHVETGFSTILNFSGAFGSIDSFAVYNGKMYVASGNTVYCFDGTSWSVALSYEYAYAFLDMQVYDGKLYLATRDLNRIPLYMGGTGFSGVIIEFDGENWTTVLGHDYWLYSLEVYDGKLYVGTANRIYTFNGTVWDVSFYSADGAYYAMSMITYDGKIYAGMGNGYVFADPAPTTANPETIVVPEFPSTTILAVFMALTMLAAALTRKNRSRRFS